MLARHIAFRAAFAAIIPLVASVAAAADPEPLANSRRPQTDSELRSWLENMVWYHRFTGEEIQAATGLERAEIESSLDRFNIGPQTRPQGRAGEPLLLVPYPGGRHPRIGFLDGAVAPQRETKLSAFLPWNRDHYVVLDLPEAIWWKEGAERELLYLAHTHVPTVWSKQGVALEPTEWEETDGALVMSRTLPNGISFGTKAIAREDSVVMEMWLTNGTREELTGLRVQACVMLKGAPPFAGQTNDNKLLREPYVACRNSDGTKWIITAWTPTQRVWANPPCPCMHSDPQFPDCAPGATVRLRGWLSFYQGEEIEREIARIESTRWRSAPLQ